MRSEDRPELLDPVSQERLGVRPYVLAQGLDEGVARVVRIRDGRCLCARFIQAPPDADD